MINSGEYVQTMKDGGKDMLKLYEDNCLVAKIYLAHSEGMLNIRSRDKFKGWQRTWDWGNSRYELGSRIQYEASLPHYLDINQLRCQCIELFGFDPGPVPD